MTRMVLLPVLLPLALLQQSGCSEQTTPPPPARSWSGTYSIRDGPYRQEGVANITFLDGTYEHRIRILFPVPAPASGGHLEERGEVRSWLGMLEFNPIRDRSLLGAPYEIWSLHGSFVSEYDGGALTLRRFRDSTHSYVLRLHEDL